MNIASAELSHPSEVFPHDAATRAVAEELRAQGMPAGAATRLRRLARGLAPFFTAAKQPQLLVLAELNAPSASAVWLSTALTEVLGVAVDAPLHLLIAGAGKAAAASKPGEDDLFVPSVSRLDAETPDALTHAIETRVRRLQGEGRSVLLYRPHASRWIANFECGAGETGCVLLARAAKTRKAAVEAFQARLVQAGLPLLGAVLLDREHAIPEALYRLL